MIHVVCGHYKESIRSATTETLNIVLNPDTSGMMNTADNGCHNSTLFRNAPDGLPLSFWMRMSVLSISDDVWAVPF